MNTSPMRRLVPLGPGELLVEAAWGGMMVVPAWNLDVSIGVARDGLHEPWTTRLVQELLRPGQVYLNAGANFGYFVTLAGRLVGSRGRVVGVEPNPHILPYLMKSLYWNGTIGNTEVVARALSDTPGEALNFEFDPQYLGGGTSLPDARFAAGATARLDVREDAIWGPGNVGRLLDGDGRWVKGAGLMVPFATETTTVDAIATMLDMPRMDLIHLDVEGAEALVVLGARGIIAASPGLRLITEWSAGHQAARPEAFDAMWDTLTDAGFQVRQLEPTIAADGGIYLSPPLSREFMAGSAPHGEYVWSREETI